MDLLTAIETRASAARIGEPAPTRAHLERILAAGSRPPDHGRLAPWRYVVLQGAAIDVLADAYVAIRRRQPPEPTPEQIDAARRKARRAPVIVVAAAHVTKGHKVPEIEQLLAVAAGVENMILAAHALGYGTMWKTGEAAYDADVKRSLGLEPDDHIVGFVYLGTTAAPGQARPGNLDHVRWA
jgi:nitroreductase